jgi:hypothetical protein
MTTTSTRTARVTLVLAAVVAAAAHVPVIAPHLEEAPYMGGLFVLFTVGCLGIAAAVAVRPTRGAYRAAAGLCGAGILTYAATRLVAFPLLEHDVGQWFEPLGVVSVLAEYTVVVCALALLMRSRPALARVAA